MWRSFKGNAAIALGGMFRIAALALAGTMAVMGVVLVVTPLGGCSLLEPLGADPYTGESQTTAVAPLSVTAPDGTVVTATPPDAGTERPTTAADVILTTATGLLGPILPGGPFTAGLLAQLGGGLIGALTRRKRPPNPLPA